eukprot:1294514-Pyramimonas_sp.AAC.2
MGVTRQKVSGSTVRGWYAMPLASSSPLRSPSATPLVSASHVCLTKIARCFPSAPSARGNTTRREGSIISGNRRASARLAMPGAGSVRRELYIGLHLSPGRADPGSTVRFQVSGARVCRGPGVRLSGIRAVPLQVPNPRHPGIRASSSGCLTSGVRVSRSQAPGV